MDNKEFKGGLQKMLYPKKMYRLFRKMTISGHFFYIIYTFLFGYKMSVISVAQFDACLTGDQEVAGLIIKYFLWSFSPVR